ncbi:hypothetical protein Acr_11g0007210 [Actinidia rufa]|uniref:Uncharacterized protein n=1 Tax=Actinidia rufa TaxID=165716 RepID=A0A7J0FCK8_9ERIC|nr:hypothetical protein Acr_11g0007210 [Actinidia rufa]
MVDHMVDRVTEGAGMGGGGRDGLERGEQWQIRKSRQQWFGKGFGWLGEDGGVVATTREGLRVVVVGSVAALMGCD